MAKPKHEDRSSSSLHKLARPCCLRCSQIISDRPTYVCQKSPGSSRCKRCIRLHKKCSPVPPVFNKMLNKLFKCASKRIAAIDTRTEARLRLRLAAKQVAFTRQVEGYIREQRRLGSSIATEAIWDSGLLIADAIGRLADTAENICDILREHVSFPLKHLCTAHSSSSTVRFVSWRSRKR